MRDRVERYINKALRTLDTLDAAGGHLDPDPDPRVKVVSLETVDGETALMLKMQDGSCYCIPKAVIEGIADVSDEVAADFQVTDGGLGIRWALLDLDLYVPNLIQGVYGTKKWMAFVKRAH